jgi:nickel transport protein
MMMRTQLTFSGLVLAVLSMASGAEAHKLLLSYWFSDGEIVGEVGLSNGTFASQAPIEISDADGQVITTIISGEDGLFRYRPTEVAELRFYTDLGGGHIARFKVTQEEIETGGQSGRADDNGLQSKSLSMDTSGLTLEQRRALPASPGGSDQAAIKALIRQELTPLRREIVALREKSSFQSILGGIGYIVGLFGLAMFWMARKQGATSKGAAAYGRPAKVESARAKEGQSL